MKTKSTLLAAALALFGLQYSAFAADPALEPYPVNTSPAPEKYGDSTRVFQGIPGLAITPKGRLWATWYSGGNDEGPDNYVMLSSSDDGGSTWSPVRAVVDPEGPVRTYDPVIWTAPDGKLWWFYAQSYRWWDGRSGVWAAVCDNPDSPNPTWATPRRLCDGIMMNKPTVLKNGNWLFPVATWTEEPKKNLQPDDRKYVPPHQLHWSADKIGTHTYLSKDGGKTLRQIGTVKFPDIQFDEHMFVEKNNGDIWVLVRSRNGIAESTSKNGGSTWGKPKLSKIPHINTRFFIRRLASGNLLLVKHNPVMDEGWLTDPAKNYNAWQNRSRLTAYLSDDDAKTWKGGLLLDERLSVAYPDGDQAPDGRIYITYDYNRKTDKEVLMATFTEADILAGKLTDPNSRLRILINKASGTPKK